MKEIYKAYCNHFNLNSCQNIKYVGKREGDFVEKLLQLAYTLCRKIYTFC